MLRGGGKWQGGGGGEARGGGRGKRGVGGGIAMSSIGGLNFPAVWGWPLVAPGHQKWGMGGGGGLG